MGIPGAGPSRGVAAILSFIIPGLGQMYLGKVGPGFVYLLSTAFCYAAASLLFVDANRTGVPGRNGGIIAVFTGSDWRFPLSRPSGPPLHVQGVDDVHVTFAVKTATEHVTDRMAHPATLPERRRSRALYPKAHEAAQVRSRAARSR